MAQSALDLLALWTAENARAVPDDKVKSEAARLAVEFTAYARDAGLGSRDLKELEEDIAETLASHMEEALKAARAMDE
jgi:hypothetical protein